MNQAFPSGNFELRTHVIKTATTTDLATVLNVSGQPPCVGVVGVFAFLNTISLAYDDTVDLHYVQASDAAANKRGHDKHFVWPMTLKDNGGDSRLLKAVTSGLGPATVIYLVNTEAPLV